MTEEQIEYQYRIRQAADSLSEVLDDLVDVVDIPVLLLEHIDAAQRRYMDAISYEP